MEINKKLEEADKERIAHCNTSKNALDQLKKYYDEGDKEYCDAYDIALPQYKEICEEDK